MPADDDHWMGAHGDLLNQRAGHQRHRLAIGQSLFRALRDVEPELTVHAPDATQPRRAMYFFMFDIIGVMSPGEPTVSGPLKVVSHGPAAGQVDFPLADAGERPLLADKRRSVGRSTEALALLSVSDPVLEPFDRHPLLVERVHAKFVRRVRVREVQIPLCLDVSKDG